MDAPTQKDIDDLYNQMQAEALVRRAGFSYGWPALESWARRVAERAVSEQPSHEVKLAIKMMLRMYDGDERVQCVREWLDSL